MGRRGSGVTVGALRVMIKRCLVCLTEQLTDDTWSHIDDEDDDEAVLLGDRMLSEGGGIGGDAAPRSLLRSLPKDPKMPSALPRRDGAVPPVMGFGLSKENRRDLNLDPPPPPPPWSRSLEIRSMRVFKWRV